MSNFDDVTRSRFGFREGEMLLKRSDEHVAFAETLTQAADDFHLPTDEFALLSDLVILDVEFATQHIDECVTAARSRCGVGR